MKVALVYDDLYQRGGGENFFKKLILLYPNAQVYSPILTKNFSGLESKVIKSSFLSLLAHLPGQFGYKLASLLSFIWFENLDLTKYDLVITLSNRFSHCIVTTAKTKHVNIVTAPFREFWEDPKDFIPNAFSLKSLAKGFFRTYSFYSAQRADLTICISKFTLKKVKKSWRINQKLLRVLHPPVLMKTKKTAQTRKPFILMLGRVNKWKYPYFVSSLRALSTQDKPVLFVGTGPLLNNLKTVFKRHNNINFLGYVSQKKLENLYSTCYALVHPQVEDFGLIPLEALGYGAYVYYLKKGGVTEYLNENVAVPYLSNKKLAKKINKNLNKSLYKKSAQKILKVHSLDNFRYNLTKIIKTLE